MYLNKKLTVRKLRKTFKNSRQHTRQAVKKDRHGLVRNVYYRFTYNYERKTTQTFSHEVIITEA